MSKARLASHLDASSRSRLSEAMLVDVLQTLKKVKKIRRITVVSADFAVRRIAQLMRVHFLWEGKRRGLNKGVRLAIRDAKGRKFSAALILPSDIPLITPREIGRFLQFSSGYPVAITPSKDGGGTNALLLRPPGVISPAFGKNSLRRHLTIANRKGLSTRLVKSMGIALDVDDPADVASLRRLSLRNETGRFLRRMSGTAFANCPVKSKFNSFTLAKKDLT
jgi:2-phospho-L-lactate guanylyltransferase